MPQDHGGCRLPKAAMMPHSLRRGVQQSANIPGDFCLHWRQEWGTMAAAVGHLGLDELADVVGWLWVVIYLGIPRVHTRQSAIPFQQGKNENPCWYQSHWCGSLPAKLVVVPRRTDSNNIIIED
jgi:hypothetical protein